MKIDDFVAERAPSWEALEIELRRIKDNANKVPAIRLFWIAKLYKSAARDLAYLKSRFGFLPGTRSLSMLVTRAHSVIYSRALQESSMSYILRRRVFESVRKLKFQLIIAVITTLAGMLIGLIRVYQMPFERLGANSGVFYGVSIPFRSVLAVTIFTHNILVALIAFAGGIIFGIPTILIVFYNGLVLGVYLGIYFRSAEGSDFLRLVLPHGVLEISCISVAAAAGMKIGAIIVNPGLYSRRESFLLHSAEIIDAVILASGFLIIAGLTEGIITPYDLNIYLATAIGIFLGAVFWLLIIFKGRRLILLNRDSRL
jgi:uncharacterized membrane protein SpoIIM required for sporulation